MALVMLACLEHFFLIAGAGTVELNPAPNSVKPYGRTRRVASPQPAAGSTGSLFASGPAKTIRLYSLYSLFGCGQVVALRACRAGPEEAGAYTAPEKGADGPEQVDDGGYVPTLDLLAPENRHLVCTAKIRICRAPRKWQLLVPREAASTLSLSGP